MPAEPSFEWYCGRHVDAMISRSEGAEPSTSMIKLRCMYGKCVCDTRVGCLFSRMDKETKIG